MKKLWLVNLAMVFAVVSLGTVASAAIWGPYTQGDVQVTANIGHCKVTLEDTDLTDENIGSGDIVRIRTTYTLSAPGDADDAYAYLWYHGLENDPDASKSAATGSYAEGSMTIERSVEPGKIYGYSARGVGTDW